MSYLGKDIIKHIAAYLSLRDLLQFGQVCKHIYSFLAERRRVKIACYHIEKHWLRAKEKRYKFMEQWHILPIRTHGCCFCRKQPVLSYFICMERFLPHTGKIITTHYVSCYRCYYDFAIRHHQTCGSLPTIIADIIEYTSLPKNSYVSRIERSKLRLPLLYVIFLNMPPQGGLPWSRYSLHL